MELDKTVFMILDKKTGDKVGVYSRAYHDEYEFASEEVALNANCHGIHKDKALFEIAKYEVTYKRVN